MRQPLFLSFLFLIPLALSTSVFRLDLSKENAKIKKEAMALYKLERCSWVGTDYVLERYQDQNGPITGYFSIENNGSYTLVFFNDQESMKVVVSATFLGDDFDNDPSIDISPRELTKEESELYQIRKVVLEDLNSDENFTLYNNTNVNLIPIRYEGEFKVYVVTAPTITGAVLFGNDYEYRFSKSLKLKEKIKLHNNLIPVNYSNLEDSTQVLLTIHQHKSPTSNLATVTDIMTLLLYQESANWEQHIIMSDEYVTVWNCKSSEVFTMTKDAWDKIYGR